MGLATWYFLRSRPGELRSISRKSMEAFFFADGTLPASEDGFVRHAQVIVELQERRAVEVVYVGFFQDRVLSSGTIDPKHRREVMEAGGTAAFGWMRLHDDPEGVVQAQHRFAKRKLDHLHHWEPIDEDVHALRELVNTKAKAGLM